MQEIFRLATLWLALAVVSTALASHLGVSGALVEICVGTVAAYVAEWYFGQDALGANQEWLRFVASAGAVVLTFLAGAELEPSSLKEKLAEVSVIGLIGFLAPFLGCAALAYWLLGWDTRASWLAGIAMSTTSMAVVYASMLDTGLNKTDYGKGILGACFINDLATVIALGLIFAPFTYRTLIFVAVSLAAFLVLPAVTRRLITLYAYRTAAIRTKWVLFVLFGLGSLALWAESEAVLPAYVVGMVLARTLGSDHFYIRRLRTLTIGFLTPFYFLRAGSFVSIPSLIAAPMVFVLLLGGKVVSKIFALYPVIRLFRDHHKECWYYTLLMSTGLTFGTISALYGLTHGIVTPEQYSYLVAAVMGSAVVPALIANIWFVPSHLLGRVPPAGEEELIGAELPSADNSSETTATG
ncbi:MAG: cation:proton antiporter [Gemmatales bacterium]|nr:cation:proton antiporter [Gemmatales bacterium]MDW7995931.1 cation:proton antiporter [Gemmatales bacterium]